DLGDGAPPAGATLLRGTGQGAHGSDGSRPDPMGATGGRGGWGWGWGWGCARRAVGGRAFLGRASLRVVRRGRAAAQEPPPARARKCLVLARSRRRRGDVRCPGGRGRHRPGSCRDLVGRDAAPLAGGTGRAPRHGIHVGTDGTPEPAGVSRRPVTGALALGWK